MISPSNAWMLPAQPVWRQANQEVPRLGVWGGAHACLAGGREQAHRSGL